MLMVGAAGCLDLNALQSGQTDMGTMPKDLAMPTEDLAMPDLAPADDLAAPDDMSPPTAWQKVYPRTGVSAPLNAIAGATDATGTIFAVGDQETVVSGTGTTFTKQPAANLTGNVKALWVASSLEVWVTSTNNNRVLFTGTAGAAFAETATAPPNKAWRGIFAKNGKNSEIVVVGDDMTTAGHWDGTKWTMPNPNPSLKQNGNGVWASDKNIWAVGNMGGSSTTNDGKKATWTALGDYTADLTAVSGADDNHVFATAKDGKLLKLNGAGNAWDAKATAAGNSPPALSALWVKDKNEVWVAGAGGAVSQCDVPAGTCTSKSNSNLNGQDLTGIWGDGKGAVYVTATNGTNGTIFKY